ncbi:death-associated protein-like 1 isoform X1 [Prinia subflava]|uniref:death-associated protein-like 1 isoform X1 n=1 Tax=Prinia subflava TaxID=208062 RepID=UPI002FE3CD43
MALRSGVPPGRRLPAVKAGGMRISKKQENGPVEKNAKPSGKEKSRYYNAEPVHPCPVVPVHSAIVSFAKPQNMGVLVAEALNKMSHKIHAAALQVAHQKPQPTLEKFILPKRIYIIQQPRKC